MRRNSVASSTSPPVSSASGGKPSSQQGSIQVWLPKDRSVVHRVLDNYFERLNFHRPVFTRASFEQRLSALYDGQVVQHDPGYVCSVYLVLALGTLSELNHRAHEKEGQGVPISATPTNPRNLMPSDWPTHEEFFERALAVKPDLRVTVSSLQALILLQWYLYTEVSQLRRFDIITSSNRLSFIEARKDAVALGRKYGPTCH